MKHTKVYLMTLKWNYLEFLSNLQLHIVNFTISQHICLVDVVNDNKVTCICKYKTHKYTRIHIHTGTCTLSKPS